MSDDTCFDPVSGFTFCRVHTGRLEKRVFRFSVGDKVAVISTKGMGFKIEFGTVTVVMKNKVRVATPFNLAGVESGTLDRDFSITSLKLWGRSDHHNFWSTDARLVSKTKSKALTEDDMFN